MPRLRFRDKRSPSNLEDRFLFLWQLAKGATDDEGRFSIGVHLNVRGELAAPRNTIARRRRCSA